VLTSAVMNKLKVGVPQQNAFPGNASQKSVPLLSGAALPTLAEIISTAKTKIIFLNTIFTPSNDI
jgi:hypothetical protein